MVKIQVDLSKEENKILEIYKAKQGCKTKEIALKKIIRESEQKKG